VSRESGLCGAYQTRSVYSTATSLPSAVTAHAAVLRQATATRRRASCRTRCVETVSARQLPRLCNWRGGGLARCHLSHMGIPGVIPSQHRGSSRTARSSVTQSIVAMECALSDRGQPQLRVGPRSPSPGCHWRSSDCRNSSPKHCHPATARPRCSIDIDIDRHRC
jgi:hypothetical protein